MRLSAALLAACALSACVGEPAPGETAASPTVDSAVAAATAGPDSVEDTNDAGPTATAMLRNAEGQEVGTVTLTGGPQGIALSGGVTGLPAGPHGIHLHAVGQCQPPFESAGPHWNPTNRQHGTQNPQGPHLGDLPNLTVDAAGLGDVSGTTPGGTLQGGDNPLLDADGAAVVVHAGPDDLRTDPSGNSGARIACGVVQMQGGS